ncbi:MAG: hypothetical protein HYY84_11325 [Deltaproteobacteria bacterium]|nr:hypothetical protein [Deltaproteobacteria bacterium]
MALRSAVFFLFAALACGAERSGGVPFEPPQGAPPTNEPPFIPPRFSGAAGDLASQRLCGSTDPAVLARAPTFAPKLAADFPRPYTMPGFPNIAIVDDDGTLVGAGDIDLAATATIYYRVFKDDRDFLFVFASTADAVSSDYNAYYRTLRNTVRGIGLSTYDNTATYGSRGRLLGVANLNSIHRWTNFLTPLMDLWPLGVIAHELGHQWIAYIKLASGTITTDPATRLRGHWQPLVHTQASIMYGNDWAVVTEATAFDGGTVPGTFESLSFPKGFSALDKYLMGVHGPEKVEPFFRIEATESVINAHYAMPGNTATGTKVAVTIDEIVARNGTRVPSFEAAQTEFKGAFILIAERGRRPTVAELTAVEYMRIRIPEHFNSATDDRFTISTALTRRP